MSDFAFQDIGSLELVEGPLPGHVRKCFFVSFNLPTAFRVRFNCPPAPLPKLVHGCQSDRNYMSGSDRFEICIVLNAGSGIGAILKSSRTHELFGVRYKSWFFGICPELTIFDNIQQLTNSIAFTRCEHTYSMTCY